MAETVSEGHARVVPLHRELGPKVESLMHMLIDSADIQVVGVTHRVKQRESALRKAATSTPPLTNIDQFHDILGLRVITFFAEDVDRVARVIEKEFEIDSARTKDKRAAIDPDRFGYLSVHYGARLGRSRRRLSEWSAYSNVWFEVQIRSVLQHAWAEIEHDLGYKSSVGSVPAEFRRRFSRLAGMLEMADEQFELLRHDLSQYERDVKGRPESVDDQDVNQVTMETFLTTNAVVLAADEAIAKGHGAQLKGPDLRYSRMRAEEMVAYGLKTIGALEDRLRAEQDVVVPLAIEWLDGSVAQGLDNGRSEMHYDQLSRGISLFYLSKYLRNSAFSPGSVLTPEEQAIQARFTDLRAEILNRTKR
jgi:putative GTP pyrophosphokinase